jgi:putative redox protein
MIETKSEGLRYRVQFTDGQHVGFADTTADKGGQNTGFRPHDLLEAALACCITMSLEMFAERHAIPMQHVRTIVQLNRGSADQTIFEIRTEFDGNLTEEQTSQLRAAAQSCPVRKTLAKAIRFQEAL